ICRQAGKEVLDSLYGLLKDDFIPTAETKVTSVIPELDFLFSERMIFNYKDYKGEPGRAFYEADLFIPGQRTKTKGVRYLPSDEFEKRRSIYSRLFRILKRRSIQILPSDDGHFQTLESLEDALAKRRCKPIK